MNKTKSEIRKSYIFNKYVIITPKRAKRPRDVKEEDIIKRNPDCPFCPENLEKEVLTDKIKAKNKAGWQVAALKNLYPAVSLNNSKAYGYQEVIVDTPNHKKDLSDLSEKEIDAVLEMFVRRTRALKKIEKIDYILCFKNQGPKSGASMTHAHSQIFATALVPENLKEEAKKVLEYKEEKKSCAYCDILKKELKSARRILEDKNIGAFAPYASEYHYEAWIFPKRHLDNISDLSLDERKSFARALKKILSKISSLNLSYNLFLHNVISDTNQHFYIKIQPRDAVFGGIELGSGLIINSVPPEKAANFYRK
jgi:UDPglucose--hexose-1-phosphate uridylyltransferase